MADANRIDLPPMQRRIDCPPEEWRMRVDLAACYRLVDLHGWTDLIYNHITARVPGSDDHILINPYGLHYREITASNLVRIDPDGNVTDGSPYGINSAGFAIHTAIHQARPDVVCVLHTHSRCGVAVSCLADGFVPMTQGGLQFHNRIGYHDYEGIAGDLAERVRLARDLGPHHAMILRNHGLLVCGDSVALAFSRMYYLEQACEVQLDAMKTGRPLALPDAGICEHTARQWELEAAQAPAAAPVAEWPACLRMLDAAGSDPDYRE